MINQPISEYPICYLIGISCIMFIQDSLNEWKPMYIEQGDGISEHLGIVSNSGVD